LRIIPARMDIERARTRTIPGKMIIEPGLTAIIRGFA
jgi:hypothetical protein